MSSTENVGLQMMLYREDKPSVSWKQYAEVTTRRNIATLVSAKPEATKQNTHWKWELEWKHTSWCTSIACLPSTTYVHVHKHTGKNTPIINFIYLDNKAVYCSCKTCCTISAPFSTKCLLPHKFIFFCSNNVFFINNVKNLNTNPVIERFKDL
jgi:hypothetical protein